MKITYIAHARMPTEKAHGFQIAKMCETFADLGHDVTLIVPKRRNSVTEDLYTYYDLKKNFTTTYLFSINTLPLSSVLGGIAYWLSAFFFLLRLFFVLPPKDNVIYTRNPEIAWFYTKRGYRTVCEVHDWPDSNVSVFLTFLKPVSLIPCNSPGTHEECLKHGLSQAMSAPNGVDLEKFDSTVSKEAAREHLGIQTQKKVAMYIGALEAWKGVTTLLEASQELSDIHVVIIGGSENEVAKLSKEYPEVQFLGYRPYKELPQNQRAADILVVPNSPESVESQKYTSPIKIFAHMAGGIPVAASDLPSIRRILDDTTATLFRAGNAQALGDAIREVMEDPDESQKKVSAALERVKSYTWRNRAENIVSRIPQ